MLGADPRDYSGMYAGDVGAGYPYPSPDRGRGTNLSTTILKGAALMAAFPIIYSLSQRGLTRLSRGMASVSTRVASRYAGKSQFARDVASSYLGQAGSALPFKGPTLGKTLGGTNAVSGLINRYRSWQRGLGIDTSAYSKWAAMSANFAKPMVRGTRIRYAARASQRAAKFRAFFRDKHSAAFKGRVVGSVEHFLRDYTVMLPGFFVAEKALGLITGRAGEEPGPRWWNFPAHVRNAAADFGRTAVGLLPIQLAFRGLAGGVKLSKDTLERSVRYKLLSRRRVPGGGSGMQEFLHNAARQIDLLRTKTVGTREAPGFESRLRGATSEFFRSFQIKWRGIHAKLPGVVPAPIQTLRAQRDNLWEGWKRGKVTAIHPLTQVPPSNFIKDLDTIRGIPLGGAYTEAVGAIMSSYERPKMGFMARMLGMRPMKFSQRIGENTIDTVMGRHLIRDMPGVTQDMMRDWLRSRYYQRGVFHAGRGRALNLSRWRPTEVISRAVDWAQERVTFAGKLRPFEIFRAKRVKDWALGKSPSVYEWTEGHRVRVGPLPPTGGAPGTVSAADLLDQYNPYGAYVELQGDSRILWVRTGRRGSGRLFYYKTGAPIALEFVQPRPYKLVETPLKGSLREVQHRFYGGIGDPLERFDAMSPAEEVGKLQEAYGWSKLRSWFHARVLRNPSDAMLREMQGRGGGWAWPGLEIGAGYGNMPGPLTRVKNLFMKYFDRTRSPLVYMSEERGFLKQLAAGGKGPHNYVEEGNLEPTIRYLRGVRNVLNESLDESWHILRRREIAQRYAEHRIDLGGRRVRLGDIFDDSASGRRRLIDAVNTILPTADPGTRLPGPWEKARHILDTVQSDEGFWSHAVTKTKRGRELTAADELKKFVFRHHLINQAYSRRDRKYLQGVIGDMSFGRRSLLTGTSREETLLRSLDTLAGLEVRLADMPMSFLPTDSTRRTELIGEYLGRRPGMPGGPINELIGYLMGEEKGLSNLAKIFQPPLSTDLPSLVKAPIFSESTTSPYEVVVKGGFPRLGGGGIVERLRGFREELFPRYMRKARSGVLAPTGRHPMANILPVPSRFLMEATMRFERLGTAMGFALNPARRTTYADIWAGIFSRIIVPGMVGYSMYNMMDAFLDTNPMFAGTMFDEGLSVAMAEQFVKGRLHMARIADLTGVTATAKHLEGLMPGFISSPAARIGRAVAPPMIGAMAGAPFGPTIAGLGMVGGMGVSATTGFGLHDLTKSREELEDIYAGREMVPVRGGRYWEFGRTPLVGGRIRYWRPNWFARMKSQYQYTPTMYGSKMEALLFRNPITMPFAMLVDPYHWERKSYFSSPYPETGGVLEGVPFMGPILSTTIGRAIKPTKLMHRKQLEASFTGITPTNTEAGTGPGYFPPPGMQVNVPSPFIPATVKETTATGMQVRRPYPRSMHGMRQTMSRMFYRSWVEPYGLWGWATESIFGGHHPFDSSTVMANAGERTSIRRQYWDLQLGGLMGQCIVGNSLIHTARGLVPIRELTKDDRVLGVDGVLRDIVHTESDGIRDNIWEIATHTTKSRVYATGHHKFPVFRGGKCKYPRLGQCTPGYKKICVHCYLNSDDITLEDVPVSEIKPGDYVTYPIIKNTDNVPIIDLAKYHDGVYTEEYIYSKCKQEYAECYELYESDTTMTREDLMKHGFSSAVCRRVTKRCDEGCKINRIARFVEITPEVAYFIGWYIAEGCTDSRTTKIYCSKVEYNILTDLERITRSFLRTGSLSIGERSSTYELRIYSTALARFLREEFGHRSEHKHIPFSYKSMPIDQTAQLFKGIVLGDGWCSSDKCMAGFTSISAELVVDVFDLGLQLGFTGSILLDYEAKGNGHILPNGIPIADHNRSYIKWNRSAVPDMCQLLYDKKCDYNPRNAGRSFIYDGKLFVQVKSAVKTNRVEEVFNLEVEGLHYYVVDRMTSSNTEYFRRFYPRQRRQIEKWNPLVNRMPAWLPGGLENEYFIDFRSGDPFTKIPEGELRLPGWGNLAAYHTKLSMPFRASQMGKSYEEMVQFLTGTRPPASVQEEAMMERGTAMHRIIQDELRRANLLVKAEAPVFEPYSNISGTVDAVVREGRRKVAIEIKTVDSKKLADMASPVAQHRSQLNFYLKGLGLREGTILYIARDNPAITRGFPVQYSESLYRADLERLSAARSKASELLERGYGYPGEAYSHLDRLRVLADVAPYSKEYKRQLQIVRQMDRMRLLSPDEHRERIDIVKRRRSTVRTYDLYPRRFGLSNIFFPDAKTYQMNENEYIKAAAEYTVPERVAGSMWEYLTHQRSPLHSKLIATYTPREQYERYVLYGSRSAFWSEPWRDFIEPYARAAMATRRPDEGIFRGLQAGFLLGGPAGAAVGAGALGVYGTVHGAYRHLTGTTHIPGRVKGKWDIYEYFDRLKYLKARRLYQMTGEEEYAAQVGETMAGLNPLSRGRQSYTQIARAVPYELRPYIFAFMRETDPGERDKIAAEVPSAVATLLRIKWAQMDGDRNSSERLANDFREGQDLTGYYEERHLPGEDWLGWHPSVRLKDVQVKTMQKEGYDAHDAGLGWYEQMRRIKHSPLTPRAIDMRDPTGNDVYPELSLSNSELRGAISGILKQAGATNVSVNLSVTPGVGSRVYLDANMDRSAELEQYVGR